ncbi:zinc finger protein 407 [Gastrophryne carolinensis]
MENDKNQKAEEAPVVEQMNKDKDIIEQFPNSECETENKSVCNKRSVSESHPKNENNDFQNLSLAKKRKLEAETSTLSELNPSDSDGTLSNVTPGPGEKLENISQTVDQNTKESCSSSKFIITREFVTYKPKSPKDVNNGFDAAGNNAQGDPTVHTEPQSKVSAKCSSKTNPIKKINKNTSSKKGRFIPSIDTVPNPKPFPTELESNTNLNQDGSKTLLSNDNVQKLTKEGIPLIPVKELGQPCSQSFSMPDSGVISSTNTKPVKSSSETKKGSTTSLNTVGKLIAKRMQDRKEIQRKGLYKRKYGFNQAKKHLQLLRRRGMLKDHMAHIKDNTFSPSDTSLAEPALEKPLERKQIPQPGMIKDVQGVIPSSAFEIVLTTPPMVQYGCIYCKTVVTTKENMFLHFWKRHARHMKFYCQACGYSCVARGDFEKHCQNDQHDQRNVLLKCYLCGLDASDEETFQSHMVAKHKMPFHCYVCKVFFKSNDDSLHHETSEEHILGIKKTQTTVGIDKSELKVSDASESTTDVNAVQVAEQEVVANEGKRQQFQCKQCFYKTTSSTVLTRHVKLRHAHEYHFLCKACSIYTMNKEGMERHIKRSKHIENANKNNIGLLFEECIEKVAYEGFSEPATSHKDRPHAQDVEVTEEDAHSKLVPPQTASALTNTPKRGRPKRKLSIYCTHCGLVASSVTNLKVHIRRRHTHQYNFKCKLCNYDTVTKCDMERHCLTKKHISRVDDQSDEPQKNEIVVTICGSKFEPSVKKKTNVANRSSRNAESGSACLQSLPTAIDSTGNIQSENDSAVSVVGGSQVQNVSTGIHSNKCAFCDFYGDSFLELHVKDKHANEFHYYCKACDVYAVSREEMNTHAATEKHKVNHESSQSIVDTMNLSENTAKNLPSAHDKPREETECAQYLEPKEVAIMEQSLNKDMIHVSESNPEIVEKQGNKDKTMLPECTGHINTQVAGSEQIEAESLPEDTDQTHTTRASENANRSTENDGLFDSSIVKLKIDSGEPLISHTRSGLEQKVPSAKKKKTNSSSQGESTRIRCDECGFLADGLSGLNVHISMKHPVKEKHFHCLLCGKSFFTENNLHQHLASIGHQKNEQASFEELPEGGGTFKCVKCTEPFESEQSLFIHIKEEHEELLREVNKYIEEDTEQINLEREENQGNVCKYCGKTCKSSNSMAFLAHIRTHTGSKPFKCKICHFAAAQLGDARNHVKRHLGMREYKCHICAVAFVMRKHLNNHLLGKHGVGTPKERKFACNLCYRTFREKWSLNNHMKLHTGEKPFKCTWPTCHYSFLTASAMKDHYRTHTGEKSYLCDLCGFAGGTRHALTKHRRQHTGEKPFKCDECNFASATQSHLTRHKRVHTGEKPYMCPWCDYRSNCAENVRKHILHTGKHEGVKMYNCPKCTYGTNAPMEFRNHLKEQHKDIENPDLAYLHAGIVSKSFECRLKGLGANFVETNSRFTASSSPETSTAKENTRSNKKQIQPTEHVQQVIIIQGFPDEYDGNITIDSSVEETAAATLQTLAMAGQVARVVHITEDGQVITTDQAAHVGSIIPGDILGDQLSEGATQVVVVEAPVEETHVAESVAIETVTDSSGNVVQKVMTQGILDVSQTVQGPDSSSALDALLCAVTELGNVGEAERKAGHQAVEESLVRVASEQEFVESSEGEIQMFQEVPEGQQEIQPINVVRQVMHSSGFVTSQDPTLRNMVQGVLQFAVCDSAAADQLMKEGVTQVILNEEGTVHMVSAEGPSFIMHNTESHTIGLPEQHMRLVECDNGEISQIIVTEELARAMVQNGSENFEEGTTHYIVTEIPQGEKESNIYSHTVIETEESNDILHTETVVDTEMPDEGTSQEISSVVVYTEYTSEDSASNPPIEQ